MCVRERVSFHVSSIAILIHAEVLENHDASAELLARYQHFNITPDLLPEFGGATDKVSQIY